LSPPGAAADDHRIHEADGSALSPGRAAAAIGVGINSLLVLGVLPDLLGALVDEHRLSADGIGLAAGLEVLVMGVSTALVGALLKPRRLRLIGSLASVFLAVIDLLTTQARGETVFLFRAGAGAAEGILLWITVSMIVRTGTPERWAGVFFTAQTLAQLVLALALALAIMPRWGADGGFVALAFASVLGLVPAFLGPAKFAPLPLAPGQGGAPPARGWAALVATLVYVAAGGAVGVYLQPLAHQAGLSADVARTALWTSLAAQVAGGGVATLLAGRVRYFSMFVVVSAVYLSVWAVLGLKSPAWVFIGANVLAGFAGLFLAPFVVPFTIEADPSRRAAMQTGAAQLLGGALGPLLAALVVSDRDVHGALWLGGGLLLAGLAGVAALRFTRSAVVVG
jgi:hypothetical protein